eukprot:m.91887 g.91887  ORF g.91887 m.91887 type:complete len:414 (+) comp26506_c1_seq2:328-1569(+)
MDFENQFSNEVNLLLSIEEAKLVKGAIIKFINNKDVAELVNRLKAVLLTPTKSVLFGTIGHFVPTDYKPRYILETGFVDDIEASSQANTINIGRTNASKTSVPTRIPSNHRIEPRVPLQSHTYEQETPPPVRPYAATRITSGPSIYDEPVVNLSRAIDGTKINKRSGVSRKTTTSTAPITTTPSNSRFEAQVLNTSPHSLSVSTSAFLMESQSRADAERILSDNGRSPGCFLVRKRDAPLDASAEQRSWVLSFVQTRGQFSHQIIVQKRPGGVLCLGAQQRNDCNSLDQLISLLRSDGNYLLKQPPYQAQLWYHSSIPREEAERRLAHTPSPCFLVRKSVREDNTAIVSMVTLEKMVIHHKLVRHGNEWIVEQSRKTFRSLYECLMANEGGKGWKIGTPCNRSSTKKVLTLRR